MYTYAECPPHTYKINYGNGLEEDVCIPCPKHSVSNAGAARCTCKPTFYRTKDEGPETDCTGTTLEISLFAVLHVPMT